MDLQKTGHEVTVVEMLDRVANESFGSYREALVWEMENCGVVCMPKTKCLEITENCVTKVDPGYKKFLSCIYGYFRCKINIFFTKIGQMGQCNFSHLHLELEHQVSLKYKNIRRIKKNTCFLQIYTQ